MTDRIRTPLEVLVSRRAALADTGADPEAIADLDAAIHRLTAPRTVDATIRVDIKGMGVGTTDDAMVWARWLEANGWTLS